MPVCTETVSLAHIIDGILPSVSHDDISVPIYQIFSSLFPYEPDHLVVQSWSHLRNCQQVNRHYLTMIPLVGRVQRGTAISLAMIPLVRARRCLLGNFFGDDAEVLDNLFPDDTSLGFFFDDDCARESALIVWHLCKSPRGTWSSELESHIPICSMDT